MEVLGGEYFGAMFGAIERVAGERGASLMVFRGTPGDVAAAPCARHVRGWIAVHSPVGLPALKRLGRPIVTVPYRDPDTEFPGVVADNVQGVRDAVGHLIAHGHRHIAFIGWLGHPALAERYEGYRTALLEAGLPYAPELLIDVEDNHRESGQAGARRLIALGVPCTAVMAGTDGNAIGILEVLQDAGYRVPDDVAVIGFDDVSIATLADPPLTTVRTRFAELGRAAAQLLLDALGGATMARAAHRVPVALIRRRSCGCDPGENGVLPSSLDAAGPGWHPALAAELVRMAMFPVVPDPERHAGGDLARCRDAARRDRRRHRRQCRTRSHGIDGRAAIGRASDDRPRCAARDEHAPRPRRSAASPLVRSGTGPAAARVSRALGARAVEGASRVRVTTLGEVTASIAHEVKQPLAAITMSADACLNLIAGGTAIEKVRDILVDIISDADRANEIIARVRALAKRSAPEQADVRPVDVVSDVLALAAPKSASRRVTIHADVRADLPVVVGDRVQLQQVLLYLVVNAMDAMADVDEAKRRLEIRGRLERIEGNAVVTISVADHGKGLAPDLTDRLFDAFFTTKPQGMGLGLAISRSIIDAHGGRLWAEANAGRGAVFSFQLPAAPGR